MTRQNWSSAFLEKLNRIYLLFDTLGEKEDLDYKIVPLSRWGEWSSLGYRKRKRLVLPMPEGTRTPYYRPTHGTLLVLLCQCLLSSKKLPPMKKFWKRWMMRPSGDAIFVLTYYPPWWGHNFSGGLLAGQPASYTGQVLSRERESYMSYWLCVAPVSVLLAVHTSG